MQVVWDKKENMQGSSPLAFLNTKLLLCSSALALLKHLILVTLKHQLDLLLEENIEQNM
jgi:hypothetical protein